MILRRALAAASAATFVLAVLASACGGSAPAAPAADPSKAGGPGAAGAGGGPGDPAGKAGGPDPAAEGAKGSDGKTAADHKRDFMTGCAKKAVNSPDYCECAWGEFRKVFSDAEMSAGEMPQEKLDKVKGQVMGACASKIPEDVIKEGYASGCSSGRPDMKPYCDCTWGEFRKRFSAAELGDDATVQSDRFLAARVPVVKACAAKMPEGVAKDAFMKGCASDPRAQPFCTCAWKELRKQVSAAEIEAASFDREKVMQGVEKSCAKLRPAKDGAAKDGPAKPAPTKPAK